jgi:hypothetical protein
MGAMMRICIACAGLLLWTAPLSAETYSWVDEKGTYNFTEDFSRVPKKYRHSVGKRGNMAPAPAPTPKESSKEAQGSDAKKTSAVPAPAAGSPTLLYGGRTIAEWKQDLSEREAAMSEVYRKVEEYDAAMKKPRESTEAYRALELERSKVVLQYKEMRKQYDQQVENARKAGIDVK